MTTIDDRYMRSVRIEAQYGAVPWACPASVTVEWTEDAPTVTDINIAIAQLAAVPALARIDSEPRITSGSVTYAPSVPS